MFTLHWADHTQNLSEQLRARAYTDATLVAEDGHSEHVHRLVLSAASDFLAGLLKETSSCGQSCSTTTLILPIDGKTLEKLVHFVYCGEIELREADVEDFLETGRWLGIKGLSGGGDTRGSGKKLQPLPQPQEEDRVEDTRVRPPTRASGRESRSPLSASSSIDSIPPAAAFNIERIQTLASLLAAGSSSNLTPGERERGGAGNGSTAAGRLAAPPRGGHGHHDLISAAAAAAAAADFKVDVFKNSDAIDLAGVGPPRASSSPENAAVRDFNQRLRATDPRPCPKCGKVYRSAHTLRTHLEDKHTVCPGYRCVLCGTIAKSRNSLHSHMSRQHRGISTKDLPLVEVARGGGGGSGYDGVGAGGGAGQGSAAKKERMTPGAPSFGDVIQAPNPLQAAGLLKGQPTTTGSAILDTYLHFIAENSLAAAAAFGGSMSNNTGSDMDDSDDEAENGYAGFGGVGDGDGEGGGD